MWTGESPAMLAAVCCWPPLGCSGNLTLAPLIFCSSRTLAPPLPMIRPICDVGMVSSTVSLTSSPLPRLKNTSYIIKGHTGNLVILLDVLL